MKILYLNPDRGIPVLGAKGASVHVREFVTALAQKGHEVVLICATAGEGNAPPPAPLIEIALEDDEAQLARECIAQGLPNSAMDDRVVRRELRRLAYDRHLCDRVRATLDGIGFRPDVIYERYALFHRAGATLAGTLGIPRLLEVNAPLIQEEEQFRGLALKPAALAAELASFQGADGIVAVSDEVATYVASTGIPGERIQTLPNGVDTARFRPDADGAAVRVKLGLGSDPVIGFVGSFKPWHGTGFLINAFGAMATLHPRIRLLCVGEGPELEVARQGIAARKLAERAVFTGRIPHADIPAHLAAMDLSVAPYLPYSGFYFSPLKVVESLAAGTPVIASRIGQLEHLIDDNRTGRLFTPGGGAEFVIKTLSLIGAPACRSAMGKAARERALAEFGWDKVVCRITQRIRHLIDLRRVA